MKSLALLGAVALISSSAMAQDASFSGFSVVRSTTAEGNIAYSVYGNFNQANRVMLNCFDFQTVSGAAMNARHQDSAETPEGDPSQSWSANTNLSGTTARNNDSWVTVSGSGTSGGNGTALDPSFTPDNASFIPFNAGWYDATPGTANNILVGGDQGGYRMLLMQIVRDGGVQDLLSTFTMKVGFKVANTTTALFGNGNFTIGLPTPGALALLGLAGLTGRRRRA